MDKEEKLLKIAVVVAADGQRNNSGKLMIKCT